MQLNENTKSHMKKMLLLVGALFGAIFLYKFGMGLFLKHSLANQSTVVTVSTTEAKYNQWASEVVAVGSVRTVLGVDVTTELAGMVKQIYFKPGSMVNKGDVLVQLNADSEIGLLISYKAEATLAKITYERNQAQFKAHAISQQTLDTNEYNYKGLVGKVTEQEATVAKKTLIAPFSGKLGISYVNPGQYLNVGDKVVTLQTLDPIYVDFFVPQQTLAQLKENQMVTITSDAFPKKTFLGKITTIDPIADKSTRNVKIEATVTNPNNLLIPGMFASVVVDKGEPKKYLTLPQTAVIFNSYGDIVYIVKKLDKNDPKNKSGETELIASQSFVVTGEKRGDQIAILDGIKEGEEIVTSGQIKLKNNSKIAINNKVLPSNNPTSDLPNEY